MLLGSRVYGRNMNRVVAATAAGGTALLVGGAVWASAAIAAPGNEPSPAPVFVRVTLSPEPAVTVVATATPEPVEVRVTVTPDPTTDESGGTKRSGGTSSEPGDSEPAPRPSPGGGDPGTSSP